MLLDDPFASVAEDITFTPEDELAAYRMMLTIRRFEEKTGQLYALGHMRGTCALAIGQEALAVGVAMAARADDPIVTERRTHGLMLARGVPPDAVMSELLGRATGISGGRGGSTGMATPELSFYGGHALAGQAAALGPGLAFASRHRGSDAVTLCVYDDVAAGTGSTIEGLSLAAEWRLPVLFVVENATPAGGGGLALGAVPSALAERGTPFAVPGSQVDGIDVRRVRTAVRRALERIRRGEGPEILEVLTFRYRGHGIPSEARGGPTERPREATDPLARSRARILDERVATEVQLKAMEKEIRERVTAASQAARAAPAPDPSHAFAQSTL